MFTIATLTLHYYHYLLLLQLLYYYLQLIIFYILLLLLVLNTLFYISFTPMKPALTEMTNTANRKKHSKTKVETDKQQVLNYLNNKSETTGDFSLKYDLEKCVELLLGKENGEVADLRGEFVRVFEEKEALFAENCDLKLENEYLRCKVKGLEGNNKRIE